MLLWVCTHVTEAGSDLRGLPQSLLLVFKMGSLTEPGAHPFSWTGWPPHSREIVASASPGWGYKCVLLLLDLDVGAGDPNSGPCLHFTH